MAWADVLTGMAIPDCLVFCAVTPGRCGTLSSDTFIQKTKKLYLDTRTQRNITKLQTDVQEVATVMTKNIAEILGQGEKMSGALLRFRAIAMQAC